jgi:density-regulated protein DRP1
MADAEHDEAAAAVERPPPPEPRVVEYDRITGVPAVFNEYLPHDCAEWKKWKAAQEDGAGAGGAAAPEAAASAGDAAAEGVGALSLGEGGEAAAAAAAGAAAAGAAAATPTEEPKKKSSKKAKDKPRVVLETNTRNKKKCITTVSGLEHFGVKLSEAAKGFGKKFACGASVVKTPSGGEQIDMQGDFLRQCAELIIKNYGGQVAKADVYFLEGKSKVPFWPEEQPGGGEAAAA